MSDAVTRQAREPAPLDEKALKLATRMRGSIYEGLHMERNRKVISDYLAAAVRQAPKTETGDATVSFESEDDMRFGPVTHGRHCRCSACAAEDWTNPKLAACGMHGPSCPPVYAPIDRAPASPETGNPPLIWHKDGPLAQIESMAGWVENLIDSNNMPASNETLRKVALNIRDALRSIAEAETGNPPSDETGDGEDALGRAIGAIDAERLANGRRVVGRRAETGEPTREEVEAGTKAIEGFHSMLSYEMPRDEMERWVEAALAASHTAGGSR